MFSKTIYRLVILNMIWLTYLASIEADAALSITTILMFILLIVGSLTIGWAGGEDRERNKK